MNGSLSVIPLASQAKQIGTKRADESLAPFLYQTFQLTNCVYVTSCHVFIELRTDEFIHSAL